MEQKITIWNDTTKNPIVLIGKAAGVCWGANTTDHMKNYKRGLDCLHNNHGRTFEFPQIYMTIEGFSARVMRELYTHIGGSPTRLQASTRYINYEDGFDSIEPVSIATKPLADAYYKECLENIQLTAKKLEELGVPREDSALVLPMAMTSTVVLRTNLRNLIDMSHQRMCSRAYWEFREFMQELIKALNEYGARYEWGKLDEAKNEMVGVNEWKQITDNYFKPKCEVCGFCTEQKCCGRKPRLNQSLLKGEVL